MPQESPPSQLECLHPVELSELSWAHDLVQQKKNDEALVLLKRIIKGARRHGDGKLPTK